MTTDDDRAAIERFLAGAPVDPDALTHAVAGRAVQRAIVFETLLRGLRDADAGVRECMAERAERMAELEPEIVAQLTLLAGTDPDGYVRGAAAVALRAHGRPVPGEDAVAAARPERSFLARLSLRVLAASRSDGQAAVSLEPALAGDAAGLTGELVPDGRGGARISFFGLPSHFVRTRPILRAGPSDDEAVDVGQASVPVSGAGQVTIAVPPDAMPFDDLVARLEQGAELVVLADA